MEQPLLQDSRNPAGIQYILNDNINSNIQQIQCCICGTQIPANPIGTCDLCLRNRVDITASIQRQLILPHCKHCNRYNRSPQWLACEWESAELLALCLKRIRGLQSDKHNDPPRVVGCKFLYTEPHSQRIKVKLTLQKEMKSSAECIIEQECVVEFVIQSTQCDDCKRAFTPHSWTAQVQIRQRVEHKRTLMYLEQVILKYDAHGVSATV